MSAGTEAVVHASGFKRPARRVSLTLPNVSSSQSSVVGAPAPPSAPPSAPAPAPKIIALGSGPRRDRFRR